MPEVDMLIPKECYVDRRDFSNHDDLYSYLVNMSDDEYGRRQLSIKEFLGSNTGSEFSVENFVDVLFAEITKSIDGVDSDKKKI